MGGVGVWGVWGVWGCGVYVRGCEGCEGVQGVSFVPFQLFRFVFLSLWRGHLSIFYQKIRVDPSRSNIVFPLERELFSKYGWNEWSSRNEVVSTPNRKLLQRV